MCWIIQLSNCTVRGWLYHCHFNAGDTRLWELSGLPLVVTQTRREVEIWLQQPHSSLCLQPWQGSASIPSDGDRASLLGPLNPNYRAKVQSSCVFQKIAMVLKRNLDSWDLASPPVKPNLLKWSLVVLLNKPLSLHWESFTYLRLYRRIGPVGRDGVEANLGQMAPDLWRLPQSRWLPGLLVCPVSVHHSVRVCRLNLCVFSIRPWAPPGQGLCLSHLSPFYIHQRSRAHIARMSRNARTRVSGCRPKDTKYDVGWQGRIMWGGREPSEDKPGFAGPIPLKLCIYYTVLFVTVSLCSPRQPLIYLLSLWFPRLDTLCNWHHMTVILPCLVCFR